MYYYILDQYVKDKYKHMIIIITIVTYVITSFILYKVLGLHVAFVVLICVSLSDKYYLSIIRNTIDIDIMKYLDDST